VHAQNCVKCFRIRSWRVSCKTTISVGGATPNHYETGSGTGTLRLDSTNLRCQCPTSPSSLYGEVSYNGKQYRNSTSSIPTRKTVAVPITLLPAEKYEANIVPDLVDPYRAVY